MNALTRWDPFRELEDMQTRLSSILGRPLKLQNDSNGSKDTLTADWSPAVDILEEENQYVIKAELPAVSRDAIKVTLENGVLVISGERRFEKEDENRKYHRIERSYGSFVRSFGLPDDADGEKVDAEFKDGILLVKVGKSEQSKPRHIEVKVA